jgi:hypothetical protein
MSSILEIWTKSRETFDTKTLSQILSFTGDGKLKDGNTTSIEFRQLLDVVPSEYLKKFADNCLKDKFDESGLALQDTINQIGTRLGFTVEHGLYRGKQNDIGFDGIWKSDDGYSLIVEVKTTDVYRINLDTIAEYRRKLIVQNRLGSIQSSILIVVGRQDTGDLEAQIRGSKQAWDIRLLSTDSLINLLTIKERFSDTRTIQQINELFKPKEYTRIDKLIDLIFLTSNDLILEQEELEDKDSEKESPGLEKVKVLPVNFNDECILKIQKKLGISFIKQSRVAFTNKEKTVGLVCAVSKAYMQGKTSVYWFAFHPHQKDFLDEFQVAYVAYGCGAAESTILFPKEDFIPFVEHMRTTTKDERVYWHVKIYFRDNKYFIVQSVNDKLELIDITKYKV